MPSIETNSHASVRNGDTAEPLAIVGMACRFPQDATDCESLWQLLLTEGSAYSPWPENRISSAGHYHPDPEHGGTFAAKGGHFLSEDPVRFDSRFFKITKSEVAALDPQQRMVLENAYHALENAGLRMEDVRSSMTSVFVSGFNHDHQAMMNADTEASLKYKVTGSTNSLLSNRVSWFFDLKGPSITIDTACSSSMVGFHLGCQSLKVGEVDMAIVTGVTVFSFPGDIAAMGYTGFLSEDGRCFSFDSRANGFGRGEGVGTLIVKRLSDAIQDGNTIRAVVRGSGVNQDGNTPGITMPNPAAQEQLMRTVYAKAGLPLEDTVMVEAHGTGTSAGDPIEAQAIARTFSSSSRQTPFILGSIKSNIGHLEGAAGVAGIIKAVFILETGIIPPNFDFKQPNRRIPLKKWNIQIPQRSTPWPSSSIRRVSINSFGVGGTNAHTILDDAYHYLENRQLVARHNTLSGTPTEAEVEHLVAAIRNRMQGDNGTRKLNEDLSSRPDGHVDQGTHPHAVEKSHDRRNGSVNGEDLGSLKALPKLIVLSAFDEDGVERIARSQAKSLRARTSFSKAVDYEFLDSYAYSLSTKRSLFPWRSTIIAGDVAEMIKKLEALVTRPIRSQAQSNLVLVFTGQGAQWPGMGKELIVYPVFKQSLSAASEYMKSLGASWLEERSFFDDIGSEIDEPYLAHPACTALQVALVDLLSSWNIKPARVLGHSSGEIAAAYCAGRLSREAAWKVSFFRGLVSGHQLKRQGAMLAVGLSQVELMPYLDRIHGQVDGEMIIACFNSPRNLTVSGDAEKIKTLKEVLDAEGVFSRLLKVQNAYHSAHMDEVSDEYAQLLRELPAKDLPQSEVVEMISSIDGNIIENERLRVDYWVQNLVKPVLFSAALIETCFSHLRRSQQSMRLDAAGSSKATAIIEIGPHGALQSAIKETLATGSGTSGYRVLSLLNRALPAVSTVLEAVGLLTCMGFPISVDAVNRATESDISPSPRLLVDLPGYVFHHSDASISESRLSKNYRLRKFPRHDLFGAPVADWNAETPRWRHIIRLSEQPWLKDHVITGAFVYPGAGYIVAAIEACRQTIDSSLKVISFRLRNISLKRALIIPDTPAGIEVSVTLTQQDESSRQSSSMWKNFAFSSYNPVADDWIEHAAGHIAVDYDVPIGPIDQGREAKAEAQSWSEKLKEVEQRCCIPIDVESLYDNISTTGLMFGPLFRNLGDLRGSLDQPGNVFGTVTVPDVAANMPRRFAHEHLVHVSTMDSFMHLFLGAVVDLEGRKNERRPMVPVFIKETWLSAAISPKPQAQYLGYGSAKPISYGKYEADIHVWDATSRQPSLYMSGIRCAPLDSVECVSTTSRRLCHEMTWTPYLELLTPESFKKVALTTDEEHGDKLFWINTFQLATILMISDALDKLKSQPILHLDGHLLKYYQWLERVQQLIQDDHVTGVTKVEWEEYRNCADKKKDLLNIVKDHSADGSLAVRMGKSIVGVLAGEIDPLELMFGQDDLLDRVYEQLIQLGDLPAQQQKYFEIVRDNCNILNILEIGAGTGSSTTAVLDVLHPRAPGDNTNPTSSVASYTFTDISSAFFEKARTKFRRFSEIMEYKILNAEQPVDSQGFKTKYYDFVIAGNVIHATADLKKTLTNLRQLLKPGGKIVMHEGMRQDLFCSAIAFGQLKGWWLSIEPIREWCPWIDCTHWAPILRDSGFSGIDLELRDNQDERLHTQSVMIATAVEVTGKSERHEWDEVAIVTTSSDDGDPNQLVEALRIRLMNVLGIRRCQVVNYLELASKDLQRTICVSVTDLERATLPDTNAFEFSNIRHMLCTCKGLLWVTQDVFQCPEFGMIVGLLRTVRWERDIDDANLVTLSLCSTNYSPSKIAEIIGILYKEQFDGTLPRENINGEFFFKDDHFLTSRLAEASGANEFLTSVFSEPKATLQPWSEANRPVKLASGAPGLLNKLQWVTDDVYHEPLGEYDVEVEVKAVGLNFRDLMIAMGEHMAFGMGSEGAGVITRVGPKVIDIQKGDRVVHICGSENMGCFHMFTRVNSKVVAKIPESLPFEAAASLSVVYGTAIYSLVDAGRLEAGETVLIHAAAGGVGQACVQLAKHIGAEIFATVSSTEKKELLMTEYQISEDHIFSSRDLTFVKGIMRMTNQRGVDVIVNSLSGEALRRSWDLIAPFGRFVETGKKDAEAAGRIELTPFHRNVTMTSVDFPTMMKNRPQLIKRLTAESVQLYLDGKVREVVPVKDMSYSQIEEGMRILQSGKGMGKMVFVPHPSDMVPLVRPKPPPYRLDPSASYVLAGGLGGLGRSIALWMAEKGARNLIFLSKSGKITSRVEKMCAALAAVKCRVHIFTCDVSDKKRLADVLEECKEKMPPIKGVIQGAMTLQDGMFENMTHNAFQSAVRPKVQGSWNLHELLPRNMDFFVLESSVTGILGNRSQANYAAGNTFQDFLAHHRRSQGLPGSSIDLVQVLGVGYVAEHGERTMVAKHLGTILEALREDEMHVLLEYLMDPQMSGPEQLITGMTDLAMYRSRGMPPPTYLSYPLFSRLQQVGSSQSSISDRGPEEKMDALLSTVTKLEEATVIVAGALRSKLASLLATSIDNIDATKSVSSNGVDSLVAMELRVYLLKNFQADVPVLDIMGTLNLAGLSKKIAGVSKLVNVQGPAEEVD